MNKKKLSVVSLIVIIALVIIVVLLTILQTSTTIRITDMFGGFTNNDDKNDVESQQPETAIITITDILGNRKGIFVNLKNEGLYQAENINVVITVTKKGILRTKILKEINETFRLDIDEEVIIETGRIFGLGKISVIININGNKTEIQGIQFFIFTRLIY